MRAITPGYPFRPRGKERGSLTLARPAPVCIGTTRPLPPPASSRLAGGILILLDQDAKIIRQASDRKVESTFRINPMLTQEGWRVGRHGKPGPLFRPTHWLKAFSGEVDPVHRRRRFAGAAGPCAQL